MDFSYLKEDDELRSSVREFGAQSIAPKTAAMDEEGAIPREIIEGMAGLGLLGITVAKEYGGSRAGFLRAALAAEELGRADMSMAVAVYYLVEAGWGFILDRYAGGRLKAEILPAVTKGTRFLGIASTEAAGGSDIASTSTTAVKHGDRLIINGAKAYISGVREAAESGGGYVTVVKTDASAGHKGLSLCYLPIKDQAGVTVSTSRQMGREGISNGFIRIQNAEVPDYYLIGEWNRGFYYAMEGFNCARVLVAAACIGAASHALEAGIKHIKGRKVFGAPLSDQQGIRFQLADNYTRLESAQLLVHKAAWMLDRMYREGGRRNDVNTVVAAAKLTAPTAAFEIIREVMMWHGAYGYTKEAGLERGLRGIASYIMGAEGAMNIMRVIISRELLEAAELHP